MIRFLRAFFALALLAASPAFAQSMTFSVPSGAAIVLCQSGAEATHTGDTAETTAATCNVPANAMGANGEIIIRALFAKTGTAGAATYKIKFGGTNINSTSPGATTLSYEVTARISNANSTGGQVGLAVSVSGGIGTSTSAKITPAIDTTQATTVTFTYQGGASGDTEALSSYQVLLYPKG
jgi:hypothetical protein